MKCSARAVNLTLAAMGLCVGFWALYRRARARSRARQAEIAEIAEIIDIASEDSFPASDPPAWNHR